MKVRKSVWDSPLLLPNPKTVKIIVSLWIDLSYISAYSTGCQHLADALAKLKLSSSLHDDTQLDREAAYYNFLLLNPTKLEPQPIGEVQPFDKFVEAVFYVGLGKARIASNHLVYSRTKCLSNLDQHFLTFFPSGRC